MTKRKALLIRMPAELHEWLKENITDESITDFIIRLIENYRTEHSEEAETLKEIENQEWPEGVEDVDVGYEIH